jgi:hypothetical protein
MPRKIFGPKMEEVTGDWREWHDEELHDFYCTTNIIWVIKSRRMRWAGLVTHMEGERNAYRVWWGHLKEEDHLEDLGVDGSTILK